MSNSLSRSCILNEETLTEKFGHTVPPLRIFSLETFAIDPETFLADMRPTFSILEIDPYDAKRSRVEFLKARFPQEARMLDVFLAQYYTGAADLSKLLHLIKKLDRADLQEFDRLGMTSHRRRSVARFIFEYTHASKYPKVTRVSAHNFQQAVGADDPRSLVRVFREASSAVADHPGVRSLMEGIAYWVRTFRPSATKLEVTLHQMFIFADVLGIGENAPEGIHQDGSHFIVSAFVIERAGILGGESIVYSLDQKVEYVRHTLQEGQGIFQADKDVLWHYVTPIQEDPSVPPAYGHRSIIGFDINVLE
jgi:hypothetical protein